MCRLVALFFVLLLAITPYTGNAALPAHKATSVAATPSTAHVPALRELIAGARGITSVKEAKENAQNVSQQLQDGHPVGDNGVLGSIALAFGIAGLACMLIAFASLGGAFLLWPVFSLVGLVTGAFGVGKRQSRRRAKIGVILGIIGLSLFLLLMVLLIAALAVIF